MSIQDSLWFQRLPAARAADQRGQSQGMGMPFLGGPDPMAYTPPVGNVIGGYDLPLASETVMPASGQGAPPPPSAGVGGGQILTQTGNPPPGTNPNSPGNLAAANAQAQGQNVPTGGSSPQQPTQNTNPNSPANVPGANSQRRAATMPPIDINTLAGMMALNPSMAAQLLALFAGTLGMGQQTAPTPQAESPPPEQPNRNISGINFRFG